MDLDKLVIKAPRGGLLATPAISAFFYSAVAVRELGPRAADAIETYLAFVGRDAMKSYVGNNGEVRLLTTRKLNKDLKQLRAWPSGVAASWIEYDSNPDGWAGESGVLLYATDLSARYEQRACNLLRFDFPVRLLEEQGGETLLNLILQLADIVPFQSGNAGYAFKRTTATRQAATQSVNRLLARYTGFDPCYQPVRESIRGRTFTAHWINVIDADLTARVGGFDDLTDRLGGADVRRLKAGTFVRVAALPPIGDTNRKARDIGLLPEVARILKPTRVEIRGFGDAELDAQRWLARFDDLDVRPWDNTTLR